ncbi:hypothetical protein, partial [Ralstonia psammae]
RKLAVPPSRFDCHQTTGRYRMSHIGRMRSAGQPKDLGAVEFEGLERLRVSVCNGELLEVAPKTEFWVLL